MKGKWIPYSAEELAFVEARKLLPRAELHAQFQATFSRADVTVAAIKALCKRKGWLTGRTGQFGLGINPWNTGKKMPFNARSAATQFRQGERRGRAAQNYQPIGTEKVMDGYLARKIHDGLPFMSRWRHVHRIRWEELHGPVPDGMALKCRGDRLNTDPDNWELVPRAILPRLNGINGRGYDTAPDEMKPAIMATTRLEHAAREARKGGRK